MQKKIRIIMIGLFLMNMFIYTGSISVQSSEPTVSQTSEPVLKIAVSVVPQIEWVTEIGGDYVEVNSLIPAGQSPHTYEPSTNELTFVSDADAWFQIGLTDFDIEYETTILDSAAFSSQEVFNLSEGLDLLYMDESHDDEIPDDTTNTTEASSSTINADPHIWLSPTRVISMVYKIRDGLNQLDPAHSSAYNTNAEEYISQLTELNTSIASKLNGVENKKMLVFHPSWSYYCEDFGLELISLEDEGKDPTSMHFQEVVDIVKEEQIGVIFVQEQISDEVALAFSEEACVEIVQINPLPENYIENLNSTSQLIAEKLDQEPSCSNRISSFPAEIMLFFSIFAVSIYFTYLARRREDIIL